MAFNTSLGTPLSSARALEVDFTEPDRNRNSLTQRARQVQAQANRGSAGASIAGFPSGDTVAADVAGAATEVEFATTSSAFTPGDDAKKGDLVAGSTVKVRAICKVTGSNGNDTLELSLRVGSDAVPGNNVQLVSTTAKDATDDDIIILESYMTCVSVGAAGILIGESKCDGGGNFSPVKSIGELGLDTDSLGLQPKIAVTAKWSTNNATNVVQLRSIEIQCAANNEALSL